MGITCVRYELFYSQVYYILINNNNDTTLTRPGRHYARVRDHGRQRRFRHLRGWLRLSQMECLARPMKGRHESPDNRPSNQEASGEEKKPHLKKRGVVVRTSVFCRIVAIVVCGLGLD